MLCADRNRWACLGDLNRCIWRSRRRVGRWEFSARLLAGMLLSGAISGAARDSPPVSPATGTGAAGVRGVVRSGYLMSRVNPRIHRPGLHAAVVLLECVVLVD